MSSKFRFLFVATGIIVAIAIVRGRQRRPVDLTLQLSPPISREVSPSQEAGTPSTTLKEVMEIARLCRDRLNSTLCDYRGRIVKQERVDGELQLENEMQFKIRNPRDGENPQSMAVYLKFLRPDASAGREVIWVADKNNGLILGHEGGWKGLVTLKLDPHGKIAMWGNRYPITEIGFSKLIEQLLERGEQIQSSGGAEVEMVENFLVGDRACLLIKVKPKQGQPGKLPDGTPFEFVLAEIALDQERSLPLYYAAYGAPVSADQPPLLLERYQYLDVEINLGLSELEFDPENPEYQFP